MRNPAANPYVRTLISNTLTDTEFELSSQSFMWTYAKTMPQFPHEYIVRGKTADEEMYYKVFRTIEARGEWGEWGGVPRQYLHPGDGFYYWKMTNVIQESIIINRAKEPRQKPEVAE